MASLVISCVVHVIGVMYLQLARQRERAVSWCVFQIRPSEFWDSICKNKTVCVALLHQATVSLIWLPCGWKMHGWNFPSISANTWFSADAHTLFMGGNTDRFVSPTAAGAVCLVSLKVKSMGAEAKVRMGPKGCNSTSVFQTGLGLWTDSSSNQILKLFITHNSYLYTHPFAHWWP